MSLLNFFKPKKKIPLVRKISIEEQINTLSKLSIKPNHDQFIEWLCDDWGREAVESDPYNLLLFALGGERELNGWESLSDDVYSFDTECVEDDDVYQVIFKHLSVLSKGDFNISDVSSEVNHDYKKASISFSFFKNKYSWQLKYNDDWFDCDVISRINYLIKDNGSSSFFYTCSPDQTLLVVFTSHEIIEELNRLITVPFVLNISDTE